MRMANQALNRATPMVGLRTLCWFTLYMALFSVSTSVHACDIRMGWQPWADYLYEQENGAIAGLEVDILTEALKRVDCRLVFQSRALWKRHISSSRSGDFDVIYSAAYSRDWTEWGYYSKPYRLEATRVFVHRDRPLADTKTLAALAKVELAALKGAFYGNEIDDFVARHKARITLTMGSPQLARLLVTGRVDAVIGDHRSIPFGARLVDGGHLIVEHPLSVSTTPVHFLFSKSSVDKAFVDRFNGALDSMQADKTLTRILQRYNYAYPVAGE